MLPPRASRRRPEGSATAANLGERFAPATRVPTLRSDPTDALWSSEQAVGPGERERLQAGVRPHRAQQVPDVVPDRLDRQVELAGDLPGRLPSRKQMQDLVLPRRQL